MSKKAVKSGPVRDTTGTGEPPPPTIYDLLEQSVWNLSTPSEQYEAFNKAFNYHIGGVCHETIFSEELFLIAVHCRKYGIIGNQSAIAIECLKQLFELLQQQQFQTRRQAFDWVCEYLKQRTSVGEDAPASVSTNEIRISADQCCHIVEYISNSILKEFDLFAAVLGYPMDHKILEISKRLPTPVSTLPSLSSATYQPIKSEPEPITSTSEQQQQVEQTNCGESAVNQLDETKEKIIARMVEIDVSNAKAEVERTIANHQAELESRMKTG